MKHSGILILSVMIFACSQKSKHADNKITLSSDDRTLKEQILKGDTTAYMQLYSHYYQIDNAVDFFPWAIIMANKYKYKRAYRDAFACLMQINNYYGKWDSSTLKTSNLLDSATMNLAKEVLYKTLDTTLINRELQSAERLYKK